MQHSRRDSRPVKSYQRWADRIPSTYRTAVLDQRAEATPAIEADSECLAMLKHYRSLMPMAIEARKPMFMLKPADGAIGAHVEAVQSCYKDFLRLAQAVALKAGITLS